jgi:rhodanese-related sulfurtransferase
MDDFPQIAVTDLPDDAVLLDIREQDEWDRGHAPGAVHIPMGELPARLGDLPDDSAGPIVVTCRSGGRVSRTLPWLAQQGFEVANLDGGMRAWHAAGKPLEGAVGEPTVV